QGCCAMKIAITPSSFARDSDEPLKLLDQAGVEYVMNDKGRALTEEETIQILEGCHGVAAGTEPLTKKVMDALPDLKVISRCGTGMDNVDRAYAAEKGIEVRNTPDGPTLAVAELTLGLILTLLAKCRIRTANCARRLEEAHGQPPARQERGHRGFGKIGLPWRTSSNCSA
ncbi:MAG: hydroxyacid dehydrogenase, partial [Bilophila wadsworthia]